MASAKDILTRILTRIAGVPASTNVLSDWPKAIPPSAFSGRGTLTENAEAVGLFVDQLFEDGVNYYRDAFMRNKDTRFKAYTSPTAFWRACLALEAGDHWEIWGRRRTSEQDWKQELVDDEIGDQIRARAAYLTANWHDVEIMPNIAHLNEILDHERKATDWSKRMRMAVKHMSLFGTATFHSILDKSENPNGYATEILCRPGTVARTPWAISFKEADGNWYAVHIEMVNQAWIRKHLPDFPLQDVQPSANFDPKKVAVLPDTDQMKAYSWTQLYVKKEAYIDDPTTVPIPFEQEEFDSRVSLILQGEPVEPVLGDNHDKWIEAYRMWVEERLAILERTEALEPITDPKELQKVQASFNLIDDQIEKHIKLRGTYEAQTGLKPGRERKYPAGR